MMSVYVAFDMIRHGQAKLDQPVTVRPETWAKWHSQGSTMFLSSGETVTVDQLLHGIITLSGNDACVVLAEGLGGTEGAYVDRMNRAAHAMGLTGSHFANTNGWPDPGEMVTPRDLAVIAERTITDFPDLYKRFYADEKFTHGKTLGAGADITQANRNPLLGRVAGADGLKTGHTDEAGYGFTGSAARDGRRLVMVIGGLSSFNERIAQSVAFMEWGFRAWDAVPIGGGGQPMATAKVWGGGADSVPLVVAAGQRMSVPRAARAEVKARVSYLSPLRAPLAKGQRVGDLIVSAPGVPDTRVPLLAGADVEAAGFFGRVTSSLRAHLGL